MPHSNHAPTRRPLHHRIETFGYRLTEPDGRTMLPGRLAEAGISGPDIGRLQHDGRIGSVRLEDVSIPRPGQCFAFVMDTAECPGADELAEDADLLVCESTFADAGADLARDYRHLTAGQAGALAARGGVGTLVLTHFSSRYQDLESLRVEAQQQAPHCHVLAAQDFERVDLPKRRTVLG